MLRIRFNPPEYKNLEMSRSLCIVRMSLKIMSRNSPPKSPKRHSERARDLMKNLETPGKTGRVGRYEMGPPTVKCGLGIKHRRWYKMSIIELEMSV